MPTGKEDLRRMIRQSAKKMDREELHISDKRIEEKVLSLSEWRKAETIFCYLSMGAEPDTRALIEAAWKTGKRVAAPRCLNDGKMEAREICNWEQLQRHCFGMLEPDVTFPLMRAGDIDLIVVPCVAVDEYQYRLGNGGGYYDRLLSTVQCSILCLCREAYVLPKLPVDSWDVSVPIIVTEERVLRKV